MKKLIYILFFAAALIGSTKAKAQFLPSSYQAIFDEIVDNFKEIRGGNSLNQGKSSLRLLSNEKIIVKIDHKKSVKTLTFIKKKDEEGNTFWIAANQLTIDMVNKYEDDLTKVLEDMLELSREEAKK